VQPRPYGQHQQQGAGGNHPQAAQTLDLAGLGGALCNLVIERVQRRHTDAHIGHVSLMAA
jgi:hypothetical protein